MSRIRRSLFLLVLALGLAGPVTAHADVWRRSLWIEGGLPVVEVWVGPHGPYRFVVDTGAEGSTVSRQLAMRLALPVLGAMEQQTTTGVVKRLLVRLTDLRIGPGGPATTEVSACVSDLEGMRIAVPDVEGVLGGDVLSAYEYQLDYIAGSLALARGEILPTRGGVVLPLRIDRHRPVVSWPRMSGLTPLLLVLDTGADALVIDDAEAASFRCRARTREAVALETHAGRRDVPSCELEPFRAGTIEVAGLRMVEVAWPTPLERLDRGLLPAAAFRRIYVSSSQGTLTLWPR